MNVHPSKKSTFLFFNGLLLIFLPLAGCKKSSEEGPDIAYEYFPMKKGHWVTYEVDSIIHDAPAEIHDTFQFQIKELIESHFTDNEGRRTARVERFKRKHDTAQWRLKDVWTANRTPRNAQKVEENIRFLKLVFPIRKGRFWDGNALNTRERNEYRFGRIHADRTIQGTHYDSTVTVIQKDRVNLVERKEAEEVYAKGIGLIHKRIIDLEIDSGNIEKGSEFKMKAIDHGP